MFVLRRQFFKNFYFLWFWILCVLPALHAEEAIAHKTIHAVQIDICNAQGVGEDFIRAHLSLKPGDQYDNSLADQSIRSLYKTGFFDYIKISLQNISDDTVDLVVQVFPKYTVEAITLEGNKLISSQKLLKQIKFKVGEPLDESSVKAANDKITEFYEARGFYKTKTTYTIAKDEATGRGKVTFHIEEKAKQKIIDVVFVGNEHVSKEKLQSLIKTKRWNIFSFFTSKGYLKDLVLREDIEAIKDHYKDLGFLDVALSFKEIVVSFPKAGRAQVTLNIHEGKQYYAGAISISGNTLYTNEKLLPCVRLKSGGFLSASVVDEDVERLTNYYGHYGYLDTYVVAERKSNLETGKIDVTYTIRESDKFYVEDILIQGNTLTKSVVIARELALAPGDVFDLIRMKNSEARLKNTGFFKQVNLSAEDTNIPNRRKLKVSVQEAKTTSISFGGGFSSLERFGLFTELTLSNFDYKNPKNYFRGAGQRCRVRLSWAQKSYEAIIGFEEPWLCQRELALGFELYHSKSDYVSEFYKQSRIGGEVYMRKWFFDRVEGKVYYGAEQVSLIDMNAAAPSYLQEEKGKRTVCKLGLSLNYDTRDNYIVPHEGCRLEGIAEVAGGPAGGPTKYFRLEGRAGQWINTFETLDQVFGAYGRLGGITSFGGKRLPLFEHYYLGGPDNLRGIEYRKASPRFPDGEPSGGRTFGFASLEYSFKLLDPVRFLGFYDAGFINAKSGDFSLRDFQHDVGIGFRIFIFGSPLRLDLGFPLKKKAYGYKNKSPVFSWSFGTSI